MCMRCFIAVMFWLVTGQLAYGQMLTSNLELKLVPNVGAGWQTVQLENSYTDPVIVCTYVLPSSADPSATTRIQNVTGTNFQLRVQQFENSASVTASDVHCIISEEGAYNSGGLKYEARKVLSDNTSGLAIGWGAATTENVTLDVTQTYTAPAVLGQVMSFGDARASVFWANDCDNRGNRPFQSGMVDGICVGKHIGQINSARNNETLGYFVIESQSGTVNDISFTAAVGADTGGGVGNSPPYSYSVTGDFDIGGLTQAGEDGGQGGWAILYGNDPLPSGQVQWAIEEEVVAGDTSRTHTTEQVAYWLFDNNQAPSMSASKGVSLYSGNSTAYALPGSDVLYGFTVENLGSGAVDTDTIVLIDALPPELTFYNDDIDDGGPETDAVIFSDGNSGLTFNPATDLRFGSGATPPANFAACNHPAITGYDPNITFVCLNPKGAFSEGTITASSFELQFRARID